jgi:transcriptional regulator with XRE-family HTH domain
MARSPSLGQAFSKLRVAIGARLREERERQGITQQSLAERFAVQRQAVVLYESGERAPVADQLAVLDQQGGDVTYVVTGRRRDEPSAKDRQDLLAAMAAVDDLCKTTSSELDGVARLKLAFEMLDGLKRKRMATSQE